MEKIRKTIAGIKSYLQGVKTEFRRVSWPSKQELKASTVIVLITLFTVTSYLWICDQIFLKIFEKLRGF